MRGILLGNFASCFPTKVPHAVSKNLKGLGMLCGPNHTPGLGRNEHQDHSGKGPINGGQTVTGWVQRLNGWVQRLNLFCFFSPYSPSVQS